MVLIFLKCVCEGFVMVFGWNGFFWFWVGWYNSVFVGVWFFCVSVGLMRVEEGIWSCGFFEVWV